MQHRPEHRTNVTSSISAILHLAILAIIYAFMHRVRLCVPFSQTVCATATLMMTLNQESNPSADNGSGLQSFDKTAIAETESCVSVGTILSYTL